MVKYSKHMILKIIKHYIYDKKIYLYTINKYLFIIKNIYLMINYLLSLSINMIKLYILVYLFNFII